MRDVRIAGSGHTRFGRRRESLLELLREAADEALAEAGGPEVDHVFVGVQNPEEFTGDANFASALTTELSLAGTPATRVETAPSTGSSALQAAFFAVASGHVSTALVVAGEKMTHRTTPEVSGILAKMMDPRERALGLTMPAVTALLARRYMHETGLSREVLARAPVKAHAHGAANPLAHFRREIALADVLASPLVADPFRLYDCAPITDGACALVVAAARGSVRLAAIGQATDVHAYTERREAGALAGFPATRKAADRAFVRARHLARADVDVIEHHDAFSVLEFVNLEDLGFFGKGASRLALESGATSLGGDLPVNVSGGLKARGHPVGATGLAMNVEIYRQLARAAGPRQVDGARVGLAHNIGGFGSNVLVTLQEVVA